MSEITFNYESIIIPGSFGDKEVHLYRCLSECPSGVEVVVLHGVHSSANPAPRNKFRYLAELLNEKGCSAWLVETSRFARSGDGNEKTTRWANEAFGGKTFAQELEDVLRAVNEVLRKIETRQIWLWGFSLGGILAAAATGKLSALPNGEPVVEKLIVSGTGLRTYAEIEQEMFTLPVLSTLKETISPDMLSLVRANWVISFRGEFDEVFPQKSCVDFIEGIALPEDRKVFHTIKSADHSLRQRNGKPDPSIMQEMVDYIV